MKNRRTKLTAYALRLIGVEPKEYERSFQLNNELEIKQRRSTVLALAEDTPDSNPVLFATLFASGAKYFGFDGTESGRKDPVEENMDDVFELLEEVAA